MRKQILCFIWLIFIGSIIGYGQEIQIKGKVDSSYFAEDTAIYLFTYDDFISYQEKQLAVSGFDKKGNFNLTFFSATVLPVFLTVGNAKAEMIAEPGKIYEVIFLGKDSDVANTFSMSVPVELEFLNSDDKELNFLLADFSSRYDNFLYDHTNMIVKKDPAIFTKIDTVKMLALKKYSLINNGYLNNYIEYTFASLEETISLKGNEKSFNRYIKNRPVQLSNPDYMAFLHQFYDDMIKSFMGSVTAQTEIHKQSFASLLNYLARSKFLENDTIRETIALKALSEVKKYPIHKVNTVLAILEQAEKECKSPQNRKSAENLRKKLSRMNVGSKVPDIKFRNQKGKIVSLSDFKGKYLYINFWASWCISCTQELALFPELKKNHGNKITFISVSVDKIFETMKNFLKKNPEYDWYFLHANDHKEMKQEFNLISVPAYLLVDPNGNILKYPAEKPQNIEPVFIGIKKKQR